MSDEVDDLDDFDDGAARPSFLSDVMLLTVAAVVGVAVLCVLSIVVYFRKDIELMKRRGAPAPAASPRRSKSLPPPAVKPRARGASPKPRGRSVPPASSRPAQPPRGLSARFRRPRPREPGSKPARTGWCTPIRGPREPRRALSAPWSTLFFADRLECLICLEPMLGGADAALVTLPCGHEFHQACFDSWRRSCATGNCCCPTCRQPLAHDAAALSNA